MKSVRLFYLTVLLATLGGMVGCGTAGGTGGGVIGFDQAGSVPTVNSFVISPKIVSRNVSQQVQYTITATLSTGEVIDATSFGTFTSSNNGSVTISGSGLATAVLPGVSTITATIGGISDTSTFTVNPFVPRMFVSNFTSSSITVYDPAVGGNQTPTRTFAGNLTTLNGPGQIAVAGQELFVANGNSTLVFSLHAKDNVAPLRTVGGSNTTLNSASGIAVSGGEMFVSNQGTNTITVFNANANGNVPPLRTIGGLAAVNTTLVNPKSLAVLNNEVLATTQTSTGFCRVVGFPTNAVGDANPTRDLSTNVGALDAFGIFINDTDLFVSDPTGSGGTGSIIRWAPTDNGVVNPTRTIAGPLNTQLSSPNGLFVRGAELFENNFATNSVGVFTAAATGDVSPSRQIVGPNTGLNGPGRGIVIAPSI